MDQANAFLAASAVTWVHDGKTYTEELCSSPAGRQHLSLVDRITVAAWMLEDVDPQETTLIFFGGRTHKVTEAQLFELKQAVSAAECARCEVLDAT